MAKAAARFNDLVITAKVRIVLFVREEDTAVQVDQGAADLLLLLISEVIKVQVKDVELWLTREDDK